MSSPWHHDASPLAVELSCPPSSATTTQLEWSPNACAARVVTTLTSVGARVVNPSLTVRAVEHSYLHWKPNVYRSAAAHAAYNGTAAAAGNGSAITGSASAVAGGAGIGGAGGGGSGDVTVVDVTDYGNPFRAYCGGVSTKGLSTTLDSATTVSLGLDEMATKRVVPAIAMSYGDDGAAEGLVWVEVLAL